MENSAQKDLSALSSSYVTTHCRTCKAGGTRLIDGKAATYCLLFLDYPAKLGVTDCDRYTPTERAGQM